MNFANGLSCCVATTPTEGFAFEVNPRTIHRSLFLEKRYDNCQERVRQLIVEAFKEMDKDPKRYKRTFYTLIPKKTWKYKSIRELNIMAKTWGDHNIDWVELALEFAQQISNGESWIQVCNSPDRANWYRIVLWKTGKLRIFGGSQELLNDDAMSSVSKHDCKSDFKTNVAVPKIVVYA